ncbi:hypothetical protein EV121DRAFT_195097 [Schizophyllum commune]
MRGRHPGVLQAFMTLLRTDRSREDMRALAARMETCTCDRSDPLVDEFHTWHWLDHDTVPGKYVKQFMPRTDTMESLVCALSSLLALPIEAATMDWKQGQRHAVWPQKTQDALGDNWAQTTTQICRWLDEYPSFQVAHLLGSFADIGDLSTPIITAMLHSATLPKNLVLLLNRAVDSYPPGIKSSDIGARMLYIMPLNLVLTLMQCIETLVIDNVSTAYFYDDQALPMLDVLTRVGRLYERTGDFDMWATLERTGGTIHAKFGLPNDTDRYHPDILHGSELHHEELIELAERTPYQTVQKVLYVLMSHTICANPDCSTVNPTSWSRCGGCNRVYYCSSQCQAAHWKCERKQHKGTCRILKSVGEAASFPTSAPADALPEMLNADFYRACAQANIQEKDLKLLVKRVLGDVRILGVLNERYAKKYDYRLS